MSAGSIRPQKGFQEQFLSSPADIVIGGGSAGGGKSYAMLMEPLRHCHNSGFGAVIFRRTRPQIMNEGGLWDTSETMYSRLRDTPKPHNTKLEWKFPSGAKVRFSYMQHEKDKYQWQGTQIALIGFDELTHFTRSQFFYLLSRNRSTCGVKPYVRVTCNPQTKGWVRTLIDWWINAKTGFPIKERCGVLRYFIAGENDKLIWGNSKQEVREKAQHILKHIPDGAVSKDDLIKSITFIPGSVYENKELLNVDPSYLANLLSLDENEKAKLLDGCWKIINQKGLVLPNWDIYRHDFPEQARYKGYGLDFGFANDPSCLYRCGVYGGKIYIKKVIHETGLTNLHNRANKKQRSLEELMRDRKVNKYDMIVADSADPKSITDLKGLGYKIKGAKKFKGSIVHGLKLLKRYQIMIHEADVEAIDNFENYTYKKDANGDYTSEPQDKDNHVPDLMRYWAEDHIGAVNVMQAF